MSEPQPSQQLVQMIVGSWVSRAIYVAAKRRVADRLSASLGPRAGIEPESGLISSHGLTGTRVHGLAGISLSHRTQKTSTMATRSSAPAAAQEVVP